MPQVVAILVTLAVASLQVVRSEHIHPAGIEGRTVSLVHDHTITIPSGSGSRAYAGHGDHGFAIFLVPIYETRAAASVEGAAGFGLSLTLLAPPRPLRAAGFAHERGDRPPPGLLTAPHGNRAPPRT